MSAEHFRNLPAEIVIREVALESKVLITTLNDATQVPREALKALYRSRWHVELDIRNIKTTLGMETLTCKTPEMVEKEMWVYLLAYNLIRILMAQSAVLSDVLPRALSFKHTLQIWNAWRGSLTSGYSQADLVALLVLIALRCVGNRPGRVEPRAMKRRPKPTPLLMQPRHEAQADIRKNGHPPKQREWNRSGQ